MIQIPRVPLRPPRPQLPGPSVSIAPPLDNRWEVRTPENISFQHALAGPFQRVLAFGLDLIFTQGGYWALVLLIAMVVFPLIGTWVGMASPAIADIFSGLLIVVVLAGSFLVTWFYGAYMETYFNGRTWGKMICSQRVLSSDGGAIDGQQAVLRNFFRAVDLFPIVGGGVWIGLSDLNAGWQFPTGMIGLIMMGITRDYQRVGDLIAGTVVVLETPQQAGAMVQFSDPRVAQLSQTLPASFTVDRDLATALSDFATRREYLGTARSEEIAKSLSRPLTRKLALPENINGDLLLCALYHRTFLNQVTDQGAATADSQNPPIVSAMAADAAASPSDANLPSRS